jgi:hypothetical protein
VVDKCITIPETPDTTEVFEPNIIVLIEDVSPLDDDAVVLDREGANMMGDVFGYANLYKSGGRCGNILVFNIMVCSIKEKSGGCGVRHF